MPSDYSTHDSSRSDGGSEEEVAAADVIAANAIGNNDWKRAVLPSAPADRRNAEAAPAEELRTDEPTEAGPPVEEPALTLGPLPDSLSLEALVESLLFVAEEAVPIARLAEALQVKPAQVEAALSSLAQHYIGRGISLQRIKDKVQLTTAPAAAAHVQRFLGLAASAPLSRAALETLAIIAYQQPVTRPQVEAIRGVNSDSVIKNLLSKGLIEEAGRTEGPGRPVLYVTTPEFLQHFGLTSLEELPPLNLENVKCEPAEVLKG
ncbi:MAG: SMC-Scp complex subunit ScpB [Anaerolineales bacterium]|nr:SMC-Scp complex subunit ScpB [Anaerolineales bacterium]